jgi:hypothetical protein
MPMEKAATYATTNPRPASAAQRSVENLAICTPNPILIIPTGRGKWNGPDAGGVGAAGEGSSSTTRHRNVRTCRGVRGGTA